MEQKSLLKIQGALEPLSRNEENQLKGGFGEVGTGAIMPLGTNIFCSNETCPKGDDSDFNLICFNKVCVTPDPTTEETTEETTPEEITTPEA